MNTNTERRKQLFESFSDKEYRIAFVRESVSVGLAHQIRVNREFRGWSQAELATRAHKSQAFISRIENPGYGQMTLKTLFEIVAAFDAGLVVKIISLGRLAEISSSITQDGLIALGFDEEIEYRADETALDQTEVPAASIDEVVQFGQEIRVLPGVHYSVTAYPQDTISLVLPAQSDKKSLFRDARTQ